MTQAVNLANFANNLDTSGGMSPNAINAAVPVSKGGTGVTTSAAVAALVGNLLYPVGSLYFNATNATNPGTLLGFGTWTAFGAGRVPVGFDASNALFDTAEETGGSANAIVVSHTHTATSTSSVTDSGHSHTVPGGANSGPPDNAYWFRQASGGTVATSTATTGISVSTSTSVASAGSSGTNANYQPYITVYIWKRTA